MVWSWIKRGKNASMNGSKEKLENNLQGRRSFTHLWTTSIRRWTMAIHLIHLIAIIGLYGHMLQA